MPDERTYYVLCDDNCRFEGMTKEQIIEAIVEATGNTPTHIDDAFITKLKEKNANAALQFWIGTTAQYNAIEEPEENVFYILTDETFADDVSAQIDELRTLINSLDVVTSETVTLSGGQATGYARFEKVGKVAICNFQITFADTMGGQQMKIEVPEGFRPSVAGNSYLGVSEMLETVNYTPVKCGTAFIGRDSTNLNKWTLFVSNYDTAGRTILAEGSVTYIL